MTLTSSMDVILEAFRHHRAGQLLKTERAPAKRMASLTLRYGDA